MKLLLKDFQTEAVDQVVRQLRRAAAEAAEGDLQAVSLSSPTGSGKTVMATAAIERLLAGDADAPPRPASTFLWITDQPELNEQTRRKMVLSSSVLDPSDLVVLDQTFDAELFESGRVYFLNTQKLARNAGLVTEGDRRSFTIWETISNTVAARSGAFFVVIDEAHRGMTENLRARNEATTIIQKFIKGSPGEIPPVPLVAGISATVERFQHLIEGTSRTARPVDVDPSAVRESGLLKEVIVLYHPHEDQPSDITMLRAAARSWREMTDRWNRYGDAEGIPAIRPILVVQVEDATGRQLSRTDLAEAIAAIDSEIGPLPDSTLAHTFQEGVPRKLGSHDVRYLSPSDVDADPEVRVVFFKTSLNTGWDCPRAEVMMSFRRALDATSIAQLVGRMVRTPLARRVDADEQLNSVPLYLPHYDTAGLQKVVDQLTAGDPEVIGPVRVEKGEDRISLARAPHTEAAFAALERLPSYVIPRPVRSSQVRRVMKLARLLANDALDPDAPEEATAALVSALDAAYERLSSTPAFKAIVEDKATITVDAVSWRLGIGAETVSGALRLTVSDENIDDLFDVAGQALAEGMHKAWWRDRIVKAGVDAERAKLEIFALCTEAGVLDDVQRAAQALTQRWLNSHASSIRNLSEASRAMYAEVQRLAAEPEIVPLSYPAEAIELTKGNRRWAKHLFVDKNGMAPLTLNAWERQVMEPEIARDDVAFWLRNFDRKPWSLAVPYELNGEPKALYPDFLVLREGSKGQFAVDILDPHSFSLEDAPAKAAGLARYADKHASGFGRIELIVVDGRQVRRIDLKDEVRRAKVRAVQTHAHLRQLFEEA